MKKTLLASIATAALLPAVANAGVDKVYSPNVELGEVELELRGIHGLEGDTSEIKFGGGYGVTDNWFIEGYLIGEKEDGDFEVEEAEIESKFQLSEQGEYWADFGMLVELEKKFDADLWEVKAGPIVQKSFGRFVATANVLFEKQLGGDKTESEVETLGSFQLKYRMNPEFEPGVEYYVDEHTQAFGPVIFGEKRLKDSKIGWELGVLAGLNDTTDDTIVRWQLEWEF